MRDRQKDRYAERKWVVYEIPGMCKQILKKLMEERDLETALFLRILMETGIRPGDIWLMRESGIKGREIRLSALKDGKEYRDLHGRYPKISKRTAQMAEIVFCYSLYFEKPYGYYTRKIKRSCEDPRFQIHLVRMYYQHIQLLKGQK